jgi:hypothetical protein
LDCELLLIYPTHRAQRVQPMLDLLRLQSEALRLAPSDHATWAEISARGSALREDLTSALNDVTSQLKLINLDTSIGRLGPSDLKRVNVELKSMMFRATCVSSILFECEI